jgi:hypothetical protein
VTFNAILVCGWVISPATQSEAFSEWIAQPHPRNVYGLRKALRNAGTPEYADGDRSRIAAMRGAEVMIARMAADGTIVADGQGWRVA